MAQSRFRSRSPHTLDTKGRLNFPSRFREVLRHYGSETLLVAPWLTHLRAYPLSEWERVETKLLTEGGQYDGGADFAHYIIGGVAECNLDKQGRILLPLELRKEVGLVKDIVLMGMVTRVEIWDKDAMEAKTQATREGFEGNIAGLGKMGIL